MLPAIREDLNLYPSGSTRSGYPNWTIHDPTRNKFFKIEWTVLEVLRRWGNGTERPVEDPGWPSLYGWPRGKPQLFRI